MAGFRNHRALVTADTAGQVTQFTFRKTPVVVTAGGYWFDLSMSPGNPIPNYYANTPLKAAVLTGTEGIYHGGGVSPSKKFLRDLMVLSSSGTGLPMRMIMQDYLLYYPFVDQGVTDPQVMDNTVTVPRAYSSDGLQMIAVLVGAQTGGQLFTVSYTNQDGVAGRTTPSILCNAQTYNGVLVSSHTNALNAAGPYLPLQKGDVGVQSIQSVTMLGADVGLMTFVLVKPLASISLFQQTAPTELSAVKDYPGMEQIQDGAYLNFICLPSGNLSGVSIHGLLTTTWN